jgi:hypothetical protein
MSRKNALISIIRLPPTGFHIGVRKERATGRPKAILPVLRLSRFSQPNKDCFTGSGCDGYVLEIFGHIGFSLSEANFVFHTQHESSVQIPVFLDP